MFIYVVAEFETPFGVKDSMRAMLIEISRWVLPTMKTERDGASYHKDSSWIAFNLSKRGKIVVNFIGDTEGLTNDAFSLKAKGESLESPFWYISLMYQNITIRLEGTVVSMSYDDGSDFHLLGG